MSHFMTLRCSFHPIMILIVLLSYSITSSSSFGLYNPNHSIQNKVLSWKRTSTSLSLVGTNSRRKNRFRTKDAETTTAISVSSTPIPDTAVETNANENPFVGRKLIHWRGEKTHGSSLQFRHAEFESAFLTIVASEISKAGGAGGDNDEEEIKLNFKYSKALCTSSLDASIEMSEYQIDAYQKAMQYVQIDSPSQSYESIINNPNVWIQTVKRCSLIRGIYEIVAEGDTYEELATDAIQQRSLADLAKGGTNANATWRVRLRQYGSNASTSSKSKQYGKKMRSPMNQERKAVMRLKDLLLTLGGEVDLKDADVSLVVMEGLYHEDEHDSKKEDDSNGNNGRKLLARLLTRGGRGGDSDKAISTIAPKTRLCVTNTPLNPEEAFTLCNIAKIQHGDRVFDPFAGSCTTLLAASMLCSSPSLSSSKVPSTMLVGVEIAHNGQVNRDDIVRDFKSRNLPEPTAIIRGDAMDERIRDDARSAVGNEPFDCIITDPPYGIREKTGYCEDPPLVQLVKCIAQDRDNNKRLLKRSGRLVAFVPNVKGEDVALGMPSEHDLKEAGLELKLVLEQPLNDSLSRWLVEYKCIQ